MRDTTADHQVRMLSAMLDIVDAALAGEPEVSDGARRRVLDLIIFGATPSVPQMEQVQQMTGLCVTLATAARIRTHEKEIKR